MEVKLRENQQIKSYKLIVSKKNDGERLDIVISKNIPEISRSAVKRLIKSENVLVNNQIKSAHYQVREGETIEVKVPEAEKSNLEILELELDIIYEDNDILVINKPPGIPVHPSAGHRNDTLVNALLGYLGKKGKLSSIGGVERPGIVHRLDKDTSGALLIAKNDITHLRLSEQFQQRKIKKVYEAILKGTIKKNTGKIESPIIRHPVNRKKFTTADYGRDSVTLFEVIDRKNDTTWIKYMPKTGRTHQLRVHSVYIGHPIIGDPIYSRGYTKYKYLALVAKSITLKHPSNGNIYTFVAKYPEHFLEIASSLGYEIDIKSNTNKVIKE